MREREAHPGFVDPHDAYLDALIRLALLEIEEEDAGRLMEQGIEALPPEELLRADDLYRRTQNKMIPKLERRLWHKRRNTTAFAKIVEIAACVILVIGIAAPFAVANVEAIRVRVMKLLVELQDDHADLSLIEDPDATFDVPAEWKGAYYPSNIPEGFFVQKVYD